MKVNLIAAALSFVAAQNAWAQAEVSEEQEACFSSGGHTWSARETPHCQCPTGKVNASSLPRGSVPEAGKDVCVDAEARNASRPDNAAAAGAPAAARRAEPARPARPAEPVRPRDMPPAAPLHSAGAPLAVERICESLGGTWRPEGDYPHCHCPAGMVHAGTADPESFSGSESQGEFCLRPIEEAEEEDAPAEPLAASPPGPSAEDLEAEDGDAVRAVVRDEVRVSLCAASGGEWDNESWRCNCPHWMDAVGGTRCVKGRWWHVGPEAGVTGFRFDTQMPAAATLGMRVSWRLRQAELVVRGGGLFAGSRDHPAGAYVGGGIVWLPWQRWNLWTGVNFNFPAIDPHFDAELSHASVEIGPAIRARGFRLEAVGSFGAVFPDEHVAVGYGARASWVF